MIEKAKKEKKNAVNHGSGLAKDRVFKLAMELKKDGVETKVVGVSMPAEGETAEKTAKINENIVEYSKSDVFSEVHVLDNDGKQVEVKDLATKVTEKSAEAAKPE